jgi:hypothetical protein
MVSEIGIGFSDMLSIAQTIGIVGTMVLTLYFSKRQLQSLSIDTQTRGLNDLGEKYLKIVERAMFYICHPPHRLHAKRKPYINSCNTNDNYYLPS